MKKDTSVVRFRENVKGIKLLSEPLMSGTVFTNGRKALFPENGSAIACSIGLPFYRAGRGAGLDDTR